MSGYLVEDKLMPEYSVKLRNRKKASHPEFCPVLVIKRKDSRFNLESTQTDQYTKHVVDDIVSAPIDKQVLLGRLENLLIRREQSLELANQYEKIEERYEQVFESAEDGIIVVDAESREVIECNTAACELLGYTQSQIRGLSASNFIDPEVTGDFSMFVQRVMTSDGGVTENVTCDTTWGQIIHAEVSAAQIRRSEEQSVLILLRDISERVRREKQIRVLNRVLRHNIRNGMNVIRGYADLIPDSADENEVREFANKISNRSDNLLELSEKSRTVSDAFQQDNRIQSLDMVGIIENVQEDLSKQYPDARFKMSMPEEVQILSNKYLKIAIQELIENAIIHCDDAEPLVDITVTESHDKAEIRIEDRGTGISDQELAMLEGEETALRHGSGLGLWLV
ncbi:histidine kinase, partial [Haloferax profundi]